MKKHELLKHAYDNYPKGTVARFGGKLPDHVSTGKFVITDLNKNGDIQVMSETGIECFFADGDWAEIVKPKIAIKVENEKEFKHLEVYLKAAHNDSVEFPCYVYPDEKTKYLTWDRENCHADYIKDYQIIPFQEFAKEHGIKLSLLTSEDGVDLYEGDDYYRVKIFRSKWVLSDYTKSTIIDNLKASHAVVHSPKSAKAFSTKQAALDWIEAQKSKNIVISPDSGYPIIVYSKPVCGDEYIHLDMSKRGDYNGANIHLGIDELREVVKAYDSLHS